MVLYAVTLNLPEPLYRRLLHTAEGMNQTLEEVLLRVIELGSPPGWDDVPAELQGDLAALDGLADDSLWAIVRTVPASAIQDSERLEELIEWHDDQPLSPAEQQEAARILEESNRLTLRKAQAVVLLKWRGHAIPPLEKLQPMRIVPDSSL